MQIAVPSRDDIPEYAEQSYGRADLAQLYRCADVGFGEALLTNPWDREGMARDLDVALRMSPEERLRRHGSLLATVSKSTALTWARDFLSAMEMA